MQLIINPKSGKLRSRYHLNKLLYFVRNFFSNAKIDITKAPFHASEIAFKAVKKGIEKIISIGGDGTLNEIISGIYSYKHVSLGLVPMGTGNDFARSLKLPNKPFKILRDIPSYQSTPIDIININEKQIGVNVIGTGIDAEVVKLLQSGKNYFLGFYRALIHHKPQNYIINIDGKKIVQKKANLIVIANGQYFGRNMFIAPMATVNDGYLNVVVVHHLNRFKFLQLFLNVYRGTHISHPNCYNLKGEKITIHEENGKQIYFEKDGELGYASEIFIQIVKKGINILLPNKYERTTNI